MSEQQFTVKVIHDDDTKKFKLPSLKFADLKNATEQLSWSQPLPQKYQYYHVEHDLPITIEDQQSFNDAVEFNVNELNSHVMRLYIGRDHRAVTHIIQRKESLRPPVVQPLIGEQKLTDKSLTISMYVPSEFSNQNRDRAQEENQKVNDDGVAVFPFEERKRQANDWLNETGNLAESIIADHYQPDPYALTVPLEQRHNFEAFKQLFDVMTTQVPKHTQLSSHFIDRIGSLFSRLLKQEHSEVLSQPDSATKDAAFVQVLLSWYAEQSVGGNLKSSQITQKIEDLIDEIKQQSSQQSSNQEMGSLNSSLAHEVPCIVCKKQIIGVRYRCFTCSDFNLCHTCEARSDHAHPLLKIKRPDQFKEERIVQLPFKQLMNVQRAQQPNANERCNFEAAGVQQMMDPEALMQNEERVIGMGEQPSVCVASRLDLHKELSGEEQVHLNLPEACMLGQEFANQDRSAQMVQVNLPIDGSSSQRESSECNQSDMVVDTYEQLREEEHVDLSSLNKAICSGNEDVKLERELVEEPIEIPPEEEQQRAMMPDPNYIGYERKLDFRYPANGPENQVRRSALIELYEMGFSQFSINLLLLDRCNDNIQAVCEMLLDEAVLVELFGPRFRELE